MALDQYLAWVLERLPKDIPDEIMKKSLNLGGYISGLQFWTYGERGPDYALFTASDENELKRWMYSQICKNIAWQIELRHRGEEVNAKIAEYESLLNKWFMEKHWSFDREQFRFVEISASREHDIYGIEEPREGAIL